MPDCLEKSNLGLLSFILIFQSLKGKIHFFESIKNRRDLNGKLNDICDFSYYLTPYNPIYFEKNYNVAYQADMKKFHWILINYSKQFPKEVLFSIRNPVIICNPVDKQEIIEQFL